MIKNFTITHAGFGDTYSLHFKRSKDYIVLYFNSFNLDDVGIVELRMNGKLISFFPIEHEDFKKAMLKADNA